ncbi:MAG: hypothetical protein ACYC3I_11320, partial [Gemmataceae bacterium]
MTHLSGSWTVIEMWTLSAEELLAANDIGLVPWVPLARTTLPPEELVRRCRERIDQQAKPEEHTNLLTVTRVKASLRYNIPDLLALLAVQRYSSEAERRKSLPAIPFPPLPCTQGRGVGGE